MFPLNVPPVLSDTVSSWVIIEKLTPLHRKTCFLMSMDTEVSYYLLNAKFLLPRLRVALERNLMTFQYTSGIVVDDLFKLVEL